MLRVEMAREVRGGEGIWIGFVKKQCFQFQTCEEIARGDVWGARRMYQIFVVILHGRSLS